MTKTLILFSFALTMTGAAVGCGDDDGPAGSSDAGRDSGPDSGPAGDAGDVPTCAAYCALMMTNCTGTNKQYVDTTACMKYCATQSGWPMGLAGTTSGSSIGCHTYHADVAGTSTPDIHCKHAGPSGANTCGTWCEVYCQAVANNCTGGNAIAFTSSCESQCAQYSTAGQPGATDGNTVQCRIYHAGIAGENPPTSAITHCPHASPSGSGVCVN
jgi:hypothetical protein